MRGEPEGGQPVTRTTCKFPDKRREGGMECGPGNWGTANRIRTITSNYLLPKLLCRAHAISQRVDKRIDATAHALQITDDDIDVLEHLFRRLARLAVLRKDW